MDYNKNQVLSGHVNEWMLSKLAAAWQSNNGLIADGKIGPKTIDALMRDKEYDHSELDCDPVMQAALKIASKDVGKGEEGGNNSGPYVEALLGKEWDGNNDDDGAWCAAFVSHCIRVGAASLGVAVPVKLSFGAKALFANFPEKDMRPQVGDVVCWDRGKLNADGTKSWMGHIGLVERVDGNMFFTIEGNVGAYPSKVRRFQYNLDNETRLEGFGRLASGSEDAPIKKRKKKSI